MTVPLRRIALKAARTLPWLASAFSFWDWPAAFLARIFRNYPASGDSFYARWARRLIPRPRIRPKRLNGYQIILRPADRANLIVYEEMFIERAYDLAPLRFLPDLVIDCGAYAGYFTLLARAKFPGAEFIAFEPNRANYSAMLENFALNGIQDVDTRCEAVSIFQGKSGFTGSGCGGHLVADHGNGHANNDAVSVDVADIRQLIEQGKARRLLLKIDVEGEEKAILPAILGVLPATCAMFFEWHDGALDYPAMEAALERAGFSVVRLRTHFPNGDGTAFVDAFAQRVGTSAGGGR